APEVAERVERRPARLGLVEGAGDEPGRCRGAGRQCGTHRGDGGGAGLLGRRGGGGRTGHGTSVGSSSTVTIALFVRTNGSGAAAAGPYRLGLVRGGRSVKLYRDRAVVLRRHKLGEADRIITLLTREHGLVRAVAKGVRRTRSRFGGRLEPFGHIDMQIYPGKHPGRGLATVTQVQILDAFTDPIVADYAVYTTASAVLETAERLAGEEHAPARDQYLLAVGALRALAAGRRAQELVLDSYLLRAMGIAGWAPALGECARCGAAGPHRAFRVAAGRAVGVHCRPPGSATPPREVVELMAALTDGRWERAEEAAATVRSQASGLTAAHLQWHLERQLRTLPLIERTRPHVRGGGATVQDEQRDPATTNAAGGR